MFLARKLLSRDAPILKNFQIVIRIMLRFLAFVSTNQHILTGIFLKLLSNNLVHTIKQKLRKVRKYFILEISVQKLREAV